MQVSSSLGIFLTTDLESWSPKIFERGRTPGHVQQWSDGRFKCQVVGSPALPHTRIVGRTRRSEILHQPPTSLLVPAAPICFLLHKTQRLRYCYSQKNPVLRTLSAWFVNMWKMIQKIKHKKTCNWFCTSARPTVFFS